jgi:hypothetical protein
MSVKAKKRGLGLDMRTIEGRDGRSYLVFRTARGGWHALNMDVKGVAT